jgi:general secretion pathway protein D
MSILVVMAGILAGVNSATVSAQDAEEFSVYRLKSKSPSEARRMLNELLGDEAKDVRIVADDDASELLVSGSPSVQKLAAKLVEQLNSSEHIKPTTKRSSIETSAKDWEFSPITNPTATSDEKPASEEWPARENTRKKTALKTDRNSALSDRTVRFRFRNITSQQAENAVSRLLGTRVLELQDHQLSFSSGRNREVSLTFDDVSKSCLLEGSEDLVQQFAKLLQQLDDVRDQATDDTIRFVPLANIEPDVLNKALLIWKQTNRTPTKPQLDSEKGQGRKTSERVIRPAGFQQIPGEPAIPIEPEPQQNSDPAADATMQEPADGALRRPSSDVTVEPLPDLDVLILRGRDPDVEELTRIIREIERLSEETAPEIDVVYLHNVQGEALEELITDVLDDLTDPLQGRVSITPLVKPNALLLIGWGEAVTAAKKLIARLDESVEPLTQMQIFSLKHASANQVEDTVRDFLNDRGGLGPEVNITADERTNSLIVNAAPRDLAEVTRLIEGLDKGTSESVNQARIVQLKNALAADVSQTITAAITAARGGVGTQRSAALEMLMVGPDGNSVVASGLLDDVKLTPDSRTNRIFITGPADSLSLVEQLIKGLDESPAASAQIKVFQITNGDATDLVQVLRSLFPEQAGVSTVPQLATAEEESSLVPVRFSVDIRTNSIIATGTSGDLKIIEALLLRLDETDSQERVNEVYRLKNSPALDVANAVNSFLRSERVVNQAAPGRQNPFTQIESEVVVVPEPVGNALIISATPRYFEQIMELVEGLDAQPPQVMIQVILVEVELDNLHEFGVELGLQDSLLFDRSLLGSILTPGYNFNNQPLGNANTAGSLATRGNVGGQALSHFSLGRTSTDTDFGGLVLSASSENVSVLLRAMNQSRNVEILSRPQIMTLDNQPAFIQVGQRVPRIVGTSINQVGQVNTVELENVGLILGVTPRISPEGMVVMEIDAEKSEVGPEIDGIPVSISSTGEVIRSPRVNITTAQTTVSSASGQTIVIGGLITTNNTTLSRRVPWLSDVPVVGNLFRFDGTKNSRKELLIILTPHVVRGPSEAEYIKQVETARMSWISCDTFNWMNTDTAMVGQMDSSTIPAIYPDQTPGAASMQQAVPLSPSPDQFINPGTTSDSINAPASPDTKVVVPEWRIETGEDDESQSTEGSGIKQMSFRSTAFKETDKKKPTNTTDSDSETQPRTKSKSEAKPKSEKKSFWSRD